MEITHSKRNLLLTLFLSALGFSIVAIWLPIPETLKEHLEILIRDPGRATGYSLLLFISCGIWAAYIISVLKIYIDALKNYSDRYNGHYWQSEMIELRLLHHVFLCSGIILGLVLIAMMMKSLAIVLLTIAFGFGLIYLFGKR